MIPRLPMHVNVSKSVCILGLSAVCVCICELIHLNKMTNLIQKPLRTAKLSYWNEHLVNGRFVEVI